MYSHPIPKSLVKFVSRETDRLQTYIELLKKWQERINLVSGSTLADAWNRHIIDSSQLILHLSLSESLVDMGSGAGFPGLVLAILGVTDVTLLESDRRKTLFLHEAARITKTKVTILNQRSEVTDLSDYQTITARGFSALPTLLSLLGSTLTSNHKLLLLKGKNYNKELVEARKAWNFDCQAAPSLTDPQSAVLTLRHIQYKETTHGY